MRFMTMALWVLALAGLLLAGCSKDEDDPPPVNEPPVVTNAAANTTAAGLGAEVLFTADCSDSDGTVIQVLIDLTALGGSAFSGMTDSGTNGDVSAGDGTYSYRHAIPTSGVVPQTGLTLTVTATDDEGGQGSDTIEGFEVTSNQAPVLTNPLASPVQGRAGTVVTFTVDVTDPDGTVAGVTIDLVGLGGLAAETMHDDGLNGDASPGDGEYTIEHTVGASSALGLGSFRITATDDAGDKASASVGFTVVTNVLPVLTNGSANPTPVNRGDPVEFTITATDADGTLTSVVIDTTPIGGTLSNAAMYDDGATGGDQVADDDTYTLVMNVPFVGGTGLRQCQVTATDDSSSSVNYVISVTVAANPGPTISNVTLTDGTTATFYHVPQSSISITADAADTQNVAGMTVNLSAIGGSTAETMYDDGGHGDGGIGDGTYGVSYLIPADAAGGLQTLVITATDGATPASQSTSNLSIRVLQIKMHKADFLYAMRGTGAGDIYLAGERGNLYHWDGIDWIAMDIKNTHATDRKVLGVMPSSTGDTFTAGVYNAVCRYDGSVWSYGTASASTSELRDAWGVVNATSTDLYVVGSSSQFHYYNGTGWTALTGLPGGGGSYYAIDGNSTTEFIAVGLSGLITRGTGPSTGTWTDESQTFTNGDEFFDVWCAGSNDYYACTGNNSTTVTYSPMILRSTTAGTWIQLTVPSVTNVDLNAIWGSSSTNVWAVGGGGIIWHSTDGTNFTNFTSPTSENLFALWGSGQNDIWAAGAKGVLLHYTGTSWTVVAESSWSDMEALALAPSGDCWVLDTCDGVTTNPAVIHYRSGTTGAWTRETNPATGANAMRDACVVSNSPLDVWAVGDNATVIQRQSGTWAVPTHSLTGNLTSVFGTSSTSVFVGGAAGLIEEYNGAGWTPYSGIAAGVTDIWGSVTGDTFAIAGSSCYHNDGTNTTFSAVTLPGTPGTLNCLWGSGSSDVWVVGDGGYVARKGASIWSQMTLPGSPTTNFYAVFGTSSNEVYVAGHNFALYRYDGTGWKRIPMSSHTELFAGGATTGAVFFCGEKGAVYQLFR